MCNFRSPLRRTTTACCASSPVFCSSPDITWRFGSELTTFSVKSGRQTKPPKTMCDIQPRRSGHSRTPPHLFCGISAQYTPYLCPASGHPWPQPPLRRLPYLPASVVLGWPLLQPLLYEPSGSVCALTRMIPGSHPRATFHVGRNTSPHQPLRYLPQPTTKHYPAWQCWYSQFRASLFICHYNTPVKYQQLSYCNRLFATPRLCNWMCFACIYTSATKSWIFSTAVRPPHRWCDVMVHVQFYPQTAAKRYVPAPATVSWCANRGWLTYPGSQQRTFDTSGDRNVLERISSSVKDTNGKGSNCVFATLSIEGIYVSSSIEFRKQMRFPKLYLPRISHRAQPRKSCMMLCVHAEVWGTTMLYALYIDLNILLPVTLLFALGVRLAMTVGFEDRQLTFT